MFTPAAVVAAFHMNVCNRRMREEMNITKVRTINELYALADKCACAEEGRQLPGEDAGAEVDSEDDDASTQKKKGRKCNRKCKGKAVMAVEGSRITGKKAKTEGADKETIVCTCSLEATADEKAKEPMVHTARFTTTKAMISRSAGKRSSLPKSRNRNMRSVTRRWAKTMLVKPARKTVAPTGAAAARANNRRRSMLEAMTRRKMKRRRTKNNLRRMSSRNL